MWTILQQLPHWVSAGIMALLSLRPEENFCKKHFTSFNDILKFYNFVNSKQIIDDSRWGRWYLRMGLFAGRSLTSPVPFGIQSWAGDSGYDKLLTSVVPPSSKCVVTLWFYCLVMTDMLSSSQQKNISIRIPVFSKVENFSTKPALRWHSQTSLQELKTLSAFMAGATH